MIVGEDASQPHFRRETVEELLAAGRFFWLDLHQPEPDDFEVLREVFKFHPLAVEDSEHFGQRAKLDEYGDYVFLVVYGAARDEDRLVEVHCFYSANYLVTVHHDDCLAFREIRERYAKRAKPIERPALLLYRIVDGLAPPSGQSFWFTAQGAAVFVLVLLAIPAVFVAAFMVAGRGRRRSSMDWRPGSRR